MTLEGEAFVYTKKLFEWLIDTTPTSTFLGLASRRCCMIEDRAERSYEIGSAYLQTRAGSRA